MLYRLYTMLGAGCLPVLYFLAPLLRLCGGRFAYRFNERLADYSLSRKTCSAKETQKRIWLHAASVGEVQVAENLIAELAHLGKYRFFLTVMTEQGRRIAENKFGGRVTCLMAPFDIPYLVKRAINDIRPDIFVCVETELWPVLLESIRQAGVYMALVNGRISSRSFSRYQRIAGLMQRLLGGFQVVVAIRPEDAQRFAALGAPKEHIRISGNSKYSTASGDRTRMRDRYRQQLNLDSATVFICGSTRNGEEELLLPVYRRLRKESKGRLVWIIAPRHLHRLTGLQEFFSKNGLETTLFSESAVEKDSADIILVDCMGELADLYAAGDFNFCGGSMVRQGGHNIMEIVRWGLPVYFGPFMHDFIDAVDMVVPAGAGFQAADSNGLALILTEHIHNKKRYDRACQAAVDVGRRQNRAVHEQAVVVQQLLEAQE